MWEKALSRDAMKNILHNIYMNWKQWKNDVLNQETGRKYYSPLKARKFEELII